MLDFLVTSTMKLLLKASRMLGTRGPNHLHWKQSLWPSASSIRAQQRRSRDCMSNVNQGRVRYLLWFFLANQWHIWNSLSKYILKNCISFRNIIMQSHISHNLTAIFSQGIKNLKHIFTISTKIGFFLYFTQYLL